MASVKQKILQAKRKETIDKPKKKTVKEEVKENETYIEKSIRIGGNLWDDLKERVKNDPDFVNKNDNEKIDVYQNSEFKDFYSEFPIVCRYMICMGQFSGKAFKRFLIKCKDSSKNTNINREKDYNENQWIMRQADYVRYLWESYQNQHFNKEDSNKIWQHAYETLKNEFKEFKDMHKKIEDKLKTDNIYNKKKLIEEMVKRISNNEQKLDDESTKKLLYDLRETLLEQRKSNLIKSIKDDVEVIPPTIISRGTVK